MRRILLICFLALSLVAELNGDILASDLLTDEERKVLWENLTPERQQLLESIVEQVRRLSPDQREAFENKLSKKIREKEERKKESISFELEPGNGGLSGESSEEIKEQTRANGTSPSLTGVPLNELLKVQHGMKPVRNEDGEVKITVYTKPLDKKTGPGGKPLIRKLGPNGRPMVWRRKTTTPRPRRKKPPQARLMDNDNEDDDDPDDPQRPRKRIQRKRPPGPRNAADMSSQAAQVAQLVQDFYDLYDDDDEYYFYYEEE